MLRHLSGLAACILGGPGRVYALLHAASGSAGEYTYIYICIKGFASRGRPLSSGCWIAGLLVVCISLVVSLYGLDLHFDSLGVVAVALGMHMGELGHLLAIFGANWQGCGSPNVLNGIPT